DAARPDPQLRHVRTDVVRGGRVRACPLEHRGREVDADDGEVPRQLDGGQPGAATELEQGCACGHELGEPFEVVGPRCFVDARGPLLVLGGGAVVAIADDPLGIHHAGAYVSTTTPVSNTVVSVSCSFVMSGDSGNGRMPLPSITGKIMNRYSST